MSRKLILVLVSLSALALIAYWVIGLLDVEVPWSKPVRGTVLRVQAVMPGSESLTKLFESLDAQEEIVAKWDFRGGRTYPEWTRQEDDGIVSMEPTEEGLVILIEAGFPIFRLDSDHEFSDFNALRVRMRVGGGEEEGLYRTEANWNWGEDIRGDVGQWVEAGSSKEEEDGFRTVDYMLGQNAHWGFHEIFRFGFVPFYYDYPNQPNKVVIASVELMKVSPARLLAESGWATEDPRLTFELDARVVVPARMGDAWFSEPFVPDADTWIAYETYMTQMLASIDTFARFQTEVWIDGKLDRVAVRSPMKLWKGAGLVKGRVEYPLRRWAGEKIRLRFVIEPVPDKKKAMGGLWIEPRLLQCGELGSDRSRPRQVTLVTLDTTRPDYLQPYGNDWVKTPVLAELASGGTLFETCYSTANSTSPSHASILSSLHVQDHQVISNEYRLAAQVETIAEKFKQAGYRTAAVVSVQHLGHRASAFGQGFDHFISPPLGFELPPAELTNERLFSLLDEDLVDQPLFLWVHYFDPHAPYEPIGEYDRMYYGDGDPTAADQPGLGHGIPEDPESSDYWRWLTGVRDPDFVRKQYAAEITYTDAQLGKMLSRLKKRAPNTLIAITADHGESLGEHGIFVEHVGLHDPVTRVPLIFNGPGVPGGRRIGGLVSTVDIAPTLLDLCSIPGLEKPRGKSLVPYFDREVPSTDVFFEHAEGWQRGLRRGSAKYLEHLVDVPAGYRGYAFEQGREEVYDLKEDPREVKSLEGEAANLEEWRKLEAKFSEDRRAFERSTGPLSPEAQKLLDQMGYFGNRPSGKGKNDPKDDQGKKADESK